MNDQLRCAICSKEGDIFMTEAHICKNCISQDRIAQLEKEILRLRALLGE